MEIRTSAHYQRLFRQRLRDQGLVKKELWILPENAARLSALEKKLRQPFENGQASSEEGEGTNMTQQWTAQTLFDAINTSDLSRSGHLASELIQGADASLHLTLKDYGDLPIFAAVIGERIVVEALLWPVSHVHDPVSFNEEVLRTQKLFPLSCIGIESLPDGQPCYTMFGALSSAASLSDVILEIQLLADNVIKATEAYEQFLR